MVWSQVTALVKRMDLDLSRPVRTMSKGNKGEGFPDQAIPAAPLRLGDGYPFAECPAGRRERLPVALLDQLRDSGLRQH